MCGILFTLSTIYQPPSPSHVALISRRGPDETCTHTVHRATRTATFTSSLLSLRGCEPVSLPYVHPPTGSALCWNGEAWRIRGAAIPAGENDTALVNKLLLSAPQGKLEEVVGSVDGEFAFVFFDGARGRVWYGRDWCGRRSLVLRRVEGRLEIASVGDGKGGWVEVEAGGLGWVDVDTGEEGWVQTRDDGSEVYALPGMNFSMLELQEKLTTGSEEVTGLYEALRESTALRVKDIPPAPDIFIHRPHILVRGEDDVRLAILFSGGVDCTTLARIAHDVLPPDEPVDLLNVAFENARIIAAKNKPSITTREVNGNGAEKKPLQEDGNTKLSTQLGDSLPVDFDPYTLCPDRLTGLSSYRSLLVACPTRRFRFVQIDVPYTAVLSHRKTIVDLMAPHATEMDLSIALAFYFASRGNGTLLTSPASSRRKNYTTQARTLLSGLGADELLGGYSRHSTAFRRSGYEALLVELQLDLHRLGKRNLGRDDRVTADWAKEMRYPFLDERVVAHCLSLPVTSKCPFADPVVDGEVENGKKVLRLLAQKLGLGNVAREAKRAVQFGARSAKMSIESRNTKGTDFLIEQRA